MAELTLGERVVEAVPELRQAYDEELAMWDGEYPGDYNIFDAVLVPFVVSLAEAGRHQDVLQRVFDIIESIASSDDQEAQAVISISVLEYLDGWHRDDLLPALRTLMGPATLKKLESIESWQPNQSPSRREEIRRELRQQAASDREFRRRIVASPSLRQLIEEFDMPSTDP